MSVLPGTTTALSDDLIRAIDAGDACSSDYDLDALVYDHAKIVGNRYSIDADEFWSVLPEYLIGIECWAKVDGHSGPWSRITVVIVGAPIGRAYGWVPATGYSAPAAPANRARDATIQARRPG